MAVLLLRKAAGDALLIHTPDNVTCSRQQTLTKYHIELGFVQSKADSCIFHYDKRQNGTGLGQLTIGVYVDDLIIAHDGKYYDWFCKKFQQRFNTTEPVKLDWFLGIGVDQHDG